MMARVGFLAAACCAFALLAQSVAAQNRAPAPGGASSDNDSRSYDPRDCRGLWSRAPQKYDLGA